MPARERLLMDPDWRFYRGDFPTPKQGQHWAKGGNFAYGPLDPAYDDSMWRLVDLPHDFVVEGDFTRQRPVSAQCPQLTGPPESRASHMMHGFLPGGVGWYRKSFLIPQQDLGRLLEIEFDGVFRNSTLWLNRHYVGTHLSGYTGFRYDITDMVNYGGWNTVVVRVDATEYEGWFYEGGGIYRHVWLLKTHRLRVAPHGTLIVCQVEPERPSAPARVIISTWVQNHFDSEHNCQLRSTVRDRQGQTVARVESELTVRPLDEAEVRQVAEVPQPALWSLETPNLYTLLSTIMLDGKAVDECETTFGIRKIHFHPDHGFFLNGRPVKLKGVGCHQDHAGVGAALPDRIQAYRIERLKEMGCNAYRSVHNPPTAELLDACDRLGMLVMAENRILGTSPEVLGQLEALVRRDRNHPCIILWSLGNEEVRLQGTEMGQRTVSTMKRLVKRLDPSRPVTLAMNGAWGRGASHVVDVQGCNYIGCGDVDAFHKEFPDKPIVFTESASAVSTRGIYANDPVRGYVDAYDRNAPSWGNLAEYNWSHCKQRPFVAGTFVWAGFDYRGEPTPYYDWPCISSHFGILDTCGFPKDSFYYYQSWWSDRTVLHVFPHWNWPGRQGQDIDVWVYSNCQSVELFLNGRSLGRQNMRRDGHLEWKVKYEPGVLWAVGRRGEQKAAEARIETTGQATAIRLVPDRATLRADGEDVAMVRVEVVDAQGRIVPDADNEIAFEASGSGRLIGVGNGDPSSHESDKGRVRRAFNGLCQAIVQAGRQAGAIGLSAHSPGLRGATVELSAAACTPRPFVPAAVTRLSFECSELQPAPRYILPAGLPTPDVTFSPAGTIGAEGLCDLREFHGGKDGLLYVRVRATVPRGGTGSLLYGADGPVKVWVNDMEVGCQPTATNPVRPDEYKARVEWKEGENIIVFALATNGGNAWGVLPRVVLS